MSQRRALRVLSSALLFPKALGQSRVGIGKKGWVEDNREMGRVKGGRE